MANPISNLAEAATHIKWRSSHIPRILTSNEILLQHIPTARTETRKKKKNMPEALYTTPSYSPKLFNRLKRLEDSYLALEDREVSRDHLSLIRSVPSFSQFVLKTSNMGF